MSTVPDRLANLLGALALGVTDRQLEAVGASGLRPIDASAINTIGQQPRLSIGDLSTILGVTHAGTVRVVDRLVLADLAARGPGSDGRTVGLTLTTAGRGAWKQLLRARQDVLTKLIDQLTAKHQHELGTILDQLLRTLTTTETDADRTCRLCNESVCPQKKCPVTIAVTGQ